GGLKPRARYMGVQAVYPGSPPTQVQFMIFNPGQLSTNPAPEASMGDSLGYPAFFVLANPIAPATPSTISEFCSPMTTDVKFWGKTAGDGALIPGSAWNVSAEICGDGIDNDNDKKVDELCGIVRQSNPAAGKGIYGSGTHLATAYNESYRDADGDGIPNNEDSCPFTAGVPDYTYGCNGCAASTCTTGDQDTDGFDNQQDSCPFTNDKETGAQCDNNTDDDGDDYVNDGCPAVGPPETGTQCANNTDDDSPPDGKVNDGCTVIGSKDDDRDAIGNPCDTLGASGIGQGPNVPDGPYVNDLVRAAVCVEAADADGDGWCDATETALGSDPNAAAKTPEYRGVDFPIVAAEDPPGTAPGTCTNWDYYDSTQNHPADPHRNGAGNKVDDDGDTLVNLADPGCVWGTTWDADADGVPTADPCEGIVAGTVTAEALRTVSRTMTLPSPPGPAKDLCLVYNSKTNFGGTWWSGLNSATVTVNASGCGAPSTVTAGTLLDGNEGIKIVWPTACVDPNESVTVQFRTDATAQPAAAPYGESCVTIWTGATGPLQVDNCPAVYNPEQRDTDGDGLGDACETDDDNDKALDSAEWAAGNDAKNVCDPVNFDLKKDGSITILDVLMFSNALMGKPCAPPVNYSVCP
ncbi:MAG: thrombospondin type 3 repeat-containing protein, partial [Chloroflexota bacterium]